MKPISVETHSNLIARYDNVIPASICNLIIDAVNSQIPQNNRQPDGSFFPWQNNETVSFVGLNNKRIQKIIDCYRFLLPQLVYEKYHQYTFPHFSDLVVWRAGMSMGKHKDSGYEGPNELQFRPRKYSSIIYLNDNYTGGETMIEQEGKPDYVSVPKQGSMVIFKSNEECIHGVNRIEEGTRYTLATWFSDEIKYCETTAGYIDQAYTGLL